MDGGGGNVAVEPTMSISETNDFVALISCGTIGLTCLGLLVDFVLRRMAPPSERQGNKQRRRPRFWSLVLLVFSYGFLLPGLLLNLFSANVALSFFGMTKTMTAMTENTVELVQRMFSTKLYLGALLVITYAMVIPALKLILLVTSAFLRSSSWPRASLWRRRCIIIVRIVSKWACPDTFAYILMMYLFRSLNKPPHLISDMKLGLGFTFFCVFCIGSTISSLGIRVPEVDASAAAAGVSEASEEAREVAAAGASAGAAAGDVVGVPAAPAATPSISSAVSRTVNRAMTATQASAVRFERATSDLALPLVPVLGLTFLGLLGVGASLPCMTLRLDMDLMYKHNPKLKDMAFVIDYLNLPELLHSEVSVFKCIGSLGEWLGEGDANCAIALVMYAVFVVAIPVLDTISLMVAALVPRASNKALAASHVFRKLGMLEVSIMGTVVIVLALSSLKENGVLIDMGPGVIPLLIAEICRYSLGFLVDRMAAASARPKDWHRSGVPVAASRAPSSFAPRVMSSASASAASALSAASAESGAVAAGSLDDAPADPELGLEVVTAICSPPASSEADSDLPLR